VWQEPIRRPEPLSIDEASNFRSFVQSSLPVNAAGPFPKSLFTWVVGALIAVVAFLLGQFSSTGSGTAKSSDASSPVPGSARDGAQSNSPAATKVDVANAGSVLLNGEQLRVQAFEILSLSDSIDRMRRLCDLMRSVTAENWREFVDAFVRQAGTTGRIHQAEWKLAMERVGQLAGKEAIEQTLASETSRMQSRTPLLLAGWASTDPKAAQQWLERQDPEMQSAYAGALLSGMARSDPTSALTLMASRYPDERDMLTPQIVEGMVQKGGVREAEELLLWLRDGADIPEAVKGSFFGGIAMRQIEMAKMRGEPAMVLEWADRYMGPNVAGPKALTSLVNFAAESDASATMKWVDSHSGDWTPKQAGSIFPAIATKLYEQAPEQFVSWVETNADHPQHDSMVGAVARKLASGGNTADAKRWIDVIKDDATRASVEQQLLNKPPENRSRTPRQ
jgi:hypothetical protein